MHIKMKSACLFHLLKGPVPTASRKASKLLLDIRINFPSTRSGSEKREQSATLVDLIWGFLVEAKKPEKLKINVFLKKLQTLQDFTCTLCYASYIIGEKN
jgi:hypothetical protein